VRKKVREVKSIIAAAAFIAQTQETFSLPKIPDQNRKNQRKI